MTKKLRYSELEAENARLKIELDEAMERYAKNRWLYEKEAELVAYMVNKVETLKLSHEDL